MAVDKGGLDKPDLVDELIRFLSPVVIDILQRVSADEFTTVQFIEVMQTDPAAKEAYDEALRRWGEDETYAKMVIHGQVIPMAMRHSGIVEWSGFAYGEDDPYAVPAWWKVTRR